MTKFPLRYAHHNILFGNGDDRAALYRIDTVSYPFLPEPDKRGWLRRLARFVYTAETDVSIYRVNRSYPVEGYVDQAMGMLDERHADPDGWERYLESHQAHLSGAVPYMPEVYVAVRLPGTMGSTRDQFRDLITGLRKRTTGGIGSRELEILQADEERTYHRAQGCLPVHRATTRELQWLLRRCQSLTEPMLDTYWKPPAIEVENEDGTVGYEPLKASLSQHVNAPMLEQERALLVDGPDGRSYQAMLAIGSLPEDTEFPGGAELLFHPLEYLPFPVDVVVHAKYIPNRDAIVRVRRKVIDADNAYEDQATSKHGAQSYAIEENRALARELRAKLESPERPPLFKASMGLAVRGASTPEELAHRVELVRQQYGTVMIHQPLGLQAEMFLDHLPRADNGAVHVYDDILTVEQLAAFMPIGTHHTGSESGAYIARTASGGRRPILFDITEASRTHRPPSILLAGTLGSGKTIAAQLLAYQAERRGSWVVDIDPKHDHNLEGLPELAGRVDVIELSNRASNRGKLDPLAVAPEAMREDLASSYLVDLLPQVPPTWETQIRKAVRDVLVSTTPCCQAVLEELERSKNPDARAVGEALGVWADSGLGRLAFGDGTQSDPNMTKPVTTIKSRSLSLPDADTHRSEYDQAERISVATLNLIAAFSMQLVTGDRTVHKVMNVDEAWFLLTSPSGRRLLNRLNRIGRTENVSLILATQQLSDVGDIENLIGTRIVFGQETVMEARHGLELQGLDPHDKSLVDRVRGYRRGRCLIRDMHGRVAESQIDVVDPELLRVLSAPQVQAA